MSGTLISEVSEQVHRVTLHLPGEQAVRLSDQLPVAQLVPQPRHSQPQGEAFDLTLAQQALRPSKETLGHEIMICAVYSHTICRHNI